MTFAGRNSQQPVVDRRVFQVMSQVLVRFEDPVESELDPQSKMQLPAHLGGPAVLAKGHFVVNRRGLSLPQHLT